MPHVGQKLEGFRRHVRDAIVLSPDVPVCDIVDDGTGSSLGQTSVGL